MGKVSMSYPFPSQDVKHNVLLSSHLDLWNVINLKIYRGSSSKAMADREKKRRRWKYKKFEYLKNEKTFLDEIKNIFHSSWRAIIWWKIKIC